MAQTTQYETMFHIDTSAPHVDFQTTVNRLSLAAPEVSRRGTPLRNRYQAHRAGKTVYIENKLPKANERLTINVEEEVFSVIKGESNLDLIVMAMMMLHQRSFYVSSDVTRSFTDEAFELARLVCEDVPFPAHWFSDGRTGSPVYQTIETPEFMDFRA